MMALEYTKTAYTMVGVDPRKGENKTAEYKKVRGASGTQVFPLLHPPSNQSCR